MATIEEALELARANLAAVQELTTGVEGIDLKLDRVAALVEELQAGQPVTQAQLDELSALVASTKDSLASVKDKVTAASNEIDAIE